MPAVARLRVEEPRPLYAMQAQCLFVQLRPGNVVVMMQSDSCYYHVQLEARPKALRELLQPHVQIIVDDLVESAS